MRGKANLITWLTFAVFLLLTTHTAATAQVIYADADANSTDTYEAITAIANPLKDSYAIGQQVPLEIVITNHSHEPVYIQVYENGYLFKSVNVEDANGITYPYMIPFPPAPPRNWWIEVDGKKILTVPVIKIESNQTITVVIQDALKYCHDQLQAGTYYLRPGFLTIIHEVGFIINREDLPVKLWINPHSIVTRSRHEINKLEIKLIQKIIYVDDDAPVSSVEDRNGGANDGSNWENAYMFLQDALADANESEKPVEIRVAQGLYTPTSYPDSNNIIDLIRATWQKFQLINGVTIRGGYAGFSEPNANARDIELYETILSGDLGGDDPDINDPWDSPYPTGWNSETVVTGSNTDETAVLDGFTITGGYIWLITFGGPVGGAGMLIHSGSPTLVNCMFTGNVTGNTGGGLLIYDNSNPTLLNCRFTRNYAGGGGGMCSLSSSPALINCEFSNNLTRYEGGGMLNRGGNPTLTNCTFIHNSTLEFFFGLNTEGGGMYNRNSNFVLNNCKFIENSAGDGGGMYNRDSNSVLNTCEFVKNTALSDGGAISNSGNLTLTRCVFNNNSAEYAGGAITTLGDSVLTGSTFTGNFSNAIGGAILVNNAILTNCLFAGNRSLGYNWPHYSQGGAVYIYNIGKAITISNCTFSKNWAYSGCSVYNDFDPSCLPNMYNCILWGTVDQISRGEEDRPGRPNLNVNWSIVQGGWEGEGNIDFDPLFVDPGYWADANDPNQIAEPNDPNAVWVEGDYHLKSQAGRYDPNSESWMVDDVTSPCIDAGDPNSPVGDEPEPNGGRINMGAYGGTEQASKYYIEE